MFGIDDAALALALAAGVSTAGSLYANSENRKQQKAINEQALNVAALNNATQIEMANSAHQREVADLRAAGLNPILSAGGSGASVPQLRTPDLGVSHVENPVSDAAHSAAQMTRYVGSSLENLQADTDVKNNTAENLATQNKNLDQQNELLRAQTLETLSKTDLNKVNAEAARYPGLVGKVFLGSKNIASDIINSGKDLYQASKGFFTPSVPSASRRYGLGGGASVDVKFEPVRETPRARHENSVHTNSNPKRRHN